MSDLVSYLFETNAIRFCEQNKPFWYTSGKIGPYFINTHFVYGSEKEATELLTFIDECLSDKLSLPEKVFEKVLKQYQTNKYAGDVVSGCYNLLNDFRKNKLIIDNDKISFKKLFINDQLAAVLEPRFIVNDEVFETFSDCYVAYGNSSLSIGDTTVVKQLTNYNRQIIIDILSVN